MDGAKDGNGSRIALCAMELFNKLMVAGGRAKGNYITPSLFKCSKLYYSVPVNVQLELGAVYRRDDWFLNSLSVSLSQDESLGCSEEQNKTDALPHSGKPKKKNKFSLPFLIIFFHFLRIRDTLFPQFRQPWLQLCPMTCKSNQKFMAGGCASHYSLPVPLIPLF